MSVSLHECFIYQNALLMKHGTADRVAANTDSGLLPVNMASLLEKRIVEFAR
jgi:hypothetical protein